MDMSIRDLQRANSVDYEDGFYWFADTRRFGKLLAHYELYRRILDIPGHIVECGVYKANSLVRLATFRQLLEAPHSREILAFDAYGAFPRDDLAQTADLEFIDRFEGAGGPGLSAPEIDGILRAKGLATDVELVAGDVRDTVPAFLARRPELRIAMLHLDMDVYEPTAMALEMLWPRVVPGGVMMVDDYNVVAGATMAVDEYFAGAPAGTLRKSPIAHVPAYVIKE